VQPTYDTEQNTRRGKKMITRDNKVKTYHIWKRALSETRIELTKQFVAKYPGIIEANEDWSDMLCLRVETLKTIV